MFVALYCPLNCELVIYCSNILIKAKSNIHKKIDTYFFLVIEHSECSTAEDEDCTQNISYLPSY